MSIAQRSNKISFRIFIISLLLALLTTVGAAAKWDSVTAFAQSVTAGIWAGQNDSPPENQPAKAYKQPVVNNSALAPLMGTYNIPGDYSDLAAAITDLNTQGVGGAVIFNLVAGNPQTAPAGGYVVGGAGSGVLTTTSAANTVTIQGNGNTITASGALNAGDLNDGIFKLIGADWITIQGFVMTENAANTTTAAASNNMTEWGVALLYVTATDGAQNNTIQNNTIDLDRTYQNTFGIYSNSTHTATAVTVTATATGAAGGNSGLKIYNNNITDVNNGIAVVGPTAAADNNDGLDIGGLTAPTGNSITNFGTTGTFSAFANVNASVFGVLVRNTKNFNVSRNTITSSNGGTTAGSLRGIYVPSFSNAPTGTISNSLNNNNVSVRSAVVAGVIQGISVEATTNSTTTSLLINNNDFNTSGHTVAASGAITFISNSASTLNTDINGNTFTNMTVNTTGSLTFITNSVTHPANAVTNASNNSIVTQFSKTGAGGTVRFYDSFGTSPGTGTETNTGNNFSNVTLTGATTLDGWRSADGTTSAPFGPAKTITNNTFTNITAGTNAITSIMTVGYSNSGSSTNNVSGNTINNISGGGAITIFTSPTASQNFFSNTVNTVSSTGASVVTVMAFTGGVAQNVYKNKFYDITANNAGGTINGILVSTIPTTINIYNNLIGDLKAPLTSNADAIRGISSTGTTATTTLNVSYNSIYLNASSSGTNFGTTGVFHTTSATATSATLNLRNNVIVNASTPNGTGLTVAYRRSSATLTNYGAGSNNNDFYAGTPGAANLIFYDGTNSDQTLAAFKARVSTRESLSVTENPPFLSTVGSNSNFLHINPATPSQLESGGAAVGGISDDFDGDTRNVSTPDIGADEFNGILLDLTGPTITYSPLGNTGSTANRVLNVTVTDPSGVPTAGVGLPVIYYKKGAGSYVSTQCVFVSGSSYSCTISSSALGGVSPADVISYYVAAQDNANNVSVSPAAGASGLTPNPPAAATPPTTPSTYTITNPALSGDYTVGVSSFNKYSGLNVTFEQRTRMVQKDSPSSDLKSNPEERESEIRNTLDRNTGNTTKVLVEEKYYVPVIDGVEQTKPLYHEFTAEEKSLNGLNPDLVGVYARVKDAVDDYNVRGVSGNVRFLLLDTLYNAASGEAFPFILSTANEAGPSASATVTIQPNTGVVSTISGSSTSGIFVFADPYLKIDGDNVGGGVSRDLTVQNTGTGASSYVIGFFNLGASKVARNSTVRYTNVRGGVTAVATTSWGIILNGSGGDYDNALIENNKIWQAFVGVGNYGVAATGINNDGIIRNNIIGEAASSNESLKSRGIEVTQSDNLKITGNEIFGFAAGNSNQIQIGVLLSTGSSNITVNKNLIHDLFYNGTAGVGCFGMLVGDNAGTTNIVNNMIYNIKGDGDQFSVTTNSIAWMPAGITVGANTGTLNVDYNSVYLTGNTLGSAFTGQSAAFSSVSGITGINLRNNALRNSMTTAGAPAATNKTFAVALLNPGTASVFSTINNNDYLADGTNPRVGYVGATDRTALSDFQTATGQDAASLSVDPLFVSTSDLHLQGASTLINAGSTLAGVTDDFDGDPRPAGTAAEIGADEALDTVAPDTMINSNPPNPSNSSTATFTFSGTDSRPTPEVIASFECNIDGGGFSTCTSPKTYMGLGDGMHNFQVRAKDGSGNVDLTPASYTWAIDATPPDTTINSNPPDPSNSADATFTFSSNEPGTFECQIDGGGFSSCSSPKTYMGLADGMHNFQVRATDSIGNVDLTPASYSWTINTATSTGPVTVTATAGTTGPTDYMTLKAAIDAINAGTHQGVITVSIVTSTTETDSSVLNSSGAGTASYTSVLIRPVSDGVFVSGPSITGRGLIELNGADNVTINGDNPNTPGTNRNLTIQNTAANTVAFTSVIRIALNTTTVNSADNDVFSNLNIVGNATGRNITTTSTTDSQNSTYGIVATANASGATTAPTALASVTTVIATGATASNLMVSNNSITTVARAVSIQGSATTVFPGLIIQNNDIGNPTTGAADQVYSFGVLAQGSANGMISGNTIYVEGFVPSSTATQGIAIGVVSATGTFTIANNKVNRVKNNNPGTWTAVGINLSGGNNHVVQNNFVSGVINNQVAGTGAFGTTFAAYGVRVGSGTGHKIYHNSVHLYDPLPGVVSTDLTAAFMIVATGQTGCDVRNNIFSNQVVGGNPIGTRNVAVFLPSGATSAMNLTWNNNAYYVGNDALNRLAQVGTTFGSGEYQASGFDPNSTTPAANFRAYTSTLSAAGTNDNASFASSSPPPVTTNTDLHIPMSTRTRLESGGAAVGVLTDIDADMRNAVTPDIGADEFTGLLPFANDVAALALVSPTNGATLPAGQIFSPQASFINNGTAAQTNVTVRYKILDSSMVVIYNQTSVIASMTPLQSVTVTFPSTSLPGAGSYTIQASSELAGDQDMTNDTITGSLTAVPPLNGTINVGTGQTYTSLTNAGGVFEALNTNGIAGNLTINITSDLTAETGAVALNQITEAGAGGYTVTVKPSGAARTISGISAASSGLIILSGADRIVFDGSLSGGNDRSLTITNNQATTGIVIWIRSPNAANGANNNTIKNCIINGAPGPNSTTVAGILTGSSVTLGGDAEAPNNNNTVQNNWIYRVQNSLYLRGGTVAANFDQNWSVTGNEFGSTVVNDKNIFRGMLVGNSKNFMIAGNLVHGIQSTTVTTAAMSGIQLALLVDSGTVVNNVISDIKNVSTSGTGSYGMQFSTSSTASNVTIANNFITDVATTGLATVNSNGFGMMFNGSGSGYNVYFNSINMNTNQGTATTTAALNVSSTFATAGALNVRNNIFSNTETTGTRYAVYSTAASSVFAAIDYNDYFAPSVGFIGGSARTTLTDWQTGTGQDANSKAVDPLFVSATDLHLQAGSPMINMGVNGTGITTDIDGDARDATPDIGADEIVMVGTPGVLALSSATYSVGESAGFVTITVNRAMGSTGAVSVNYSMIDGTATGGAACGGNVDYVNTGGTVNFTNGQTSQTFNVPICPDVVNKMNETFNVMISGATGGATIGSPSSAVVTILDDDPQPSLSISDVRQFEGNAGPTTFTFNVSLSAVSGQTVTVHYQTMNGTATAPTDYSAISDTVLTFNPGQTTLPVAVTVTGDLTKEANETFFVNLSNPANASISDAQGVGIIIDEDRSYVADFDRDLNADFSVFRPSEGAWYVLQSNGNTPNIFSFGLNGDSPVPGDYDGDGKTDAAVFRPSTGTWYRLLSSNQSLQVTDWGSNGDKPVQGDYDGDGKTDLAIFRPSTGTWWILQSSNGNSMSIPFGLSTDRPVQGDYDGDAKTDIAVYRDGTWYIRQSSNGAIRIETWGVAADKPVSGDFDGDGKYDLAIYRNGDWWINNSLTGTLQTIHWGLAADIPVSADYDHDGTTDIAIWRPSTGDWYVLRSSNGSAIIVHWGLTGDTPIPAAYLPQ